MRASIPVSLLVCIACRTACGGSSTDHDAAPFVDAGPDGAVDAAGPDAEIPGDIWIDGTRLQHVTLAGDDGFSMTAGWWDSERDEGCGFVPTDPFGSEWVC